MYVLGVVGESARAIADDLAEQFGGDERVAVVTREHPDIEDGAPGDTRVQFGEDGWRASGRDRSLSDLLEDLAPEYDYAVLAGFPEADVPQVIVGDASARGTALVEAAEPADLDPAEVRARLDATEPYETLESLVAEAKRSADAPFSGAIATFTGRVRAKDDDDDEPTEYLEFEKYEGVAEERMTAIESELEDRDGVFDVLLYHRTGVIEYGEDIVFVVVLAGHREEAFRTVEDGINRLKDEVPIFKKEVTTDEQFWVHERS
ncbi:molybdopterin synthase [Halorussus marinus]|uniref:molybdopterin synthase n=1 Tax=Halorussus marinus TaxID=2505976 RepID=UPI00106E3B9E|nr:molybdopterin synthase [Halorussus marinus]